MRAAASEENLSRYRIDPKQLEKNKLHKASYEGDLNKVNRLAQPGAIDRLDQQRRVSLNIRKTINSSFSFDLDALALRNR